MTFNPANRFAPTKITSEPITSLKNGSRVAKDGTDLTAWIQIFYPKRRLGESICWLRSWSALSICCLRVMSRAFAP